MNSAADTDIHLSSASQNDSNLKQDGSQSPGSRSASVHCRLLRGTLFTILPVPRFRYSATGSRLGEEEGRAGNVLPQSFQLRGDSEVADGCARSVFEVCEFFWGRRPRETRFSVLSETLCVSAKGVHEC